MSYSSDLIRRMQESGVWDGLTVDQQSRFQNLTDDQARQLMVIEDHWKMGDKESVEVVGMVSLVRMILSFNGALVEHEGDKIGKLSDAGKMLARFFVELDERGLTPDDVESGLQRMSPLAIAALKTVYKRTVE